MSATCAVSRAAANRRTGSELELGNDAQAIANMRWDRRGSRKSLPRSHAAAAETSVTPKKPCGVRPGKQEAAYEWDDVQLTELVGRERKRDLAEQQRRREDRDVDAVDELASLGVQNAPARQPVANDTD